MKKTNLLLLKTIANTIKNSLPHAFDHHYWSMANTTFKEEIAWSYINDLGLNVEASKKFLRMCGLPKKDYPILYYVLDGHLKESMGAHYGVTPIGDKFLDKFLMGKRR
jgi:hypothetical protein